MALEIVFLLFRCFVFCFTSGWWLARGLRAKSVIGLAPETDEGSVGNPLVPPATAFAEFASAF